VIPNAQSFQLLGEDLIALTGEDLILSGARLQSALYV